jgi:hypothetical protein
MGEENCPIRQTHYLNSASLMRTGRKITPALPYFLLRSKASYRCGPLQYKFLTLPTGPHLSSLLQVCRASKIVRS